MSGSVSYVGERVHINVVVVQLLRGAGAARLCKQHTQPTAQILGAAGLLDRTQENSEHVTESSCQIITVGVTATGAAHL